ncbi:nitronate monooxygenase [Rhodobacteraceae bacterium 2CG4]|uniref:Nitronate monooxygenase n=1 Tax=Halovulum marinum TaxID=2662447 RepID=A0A6L5YWS6_9RHOB|nr:nitronate monooxygenase [Halovulum marinum]MSU88430.1 nitronate monooxygenase [Halovulum marinum]
MGLQTRLTDLFGVSYPLMSAPMSRHSGGRLAGAMTKAGGIGLFGATNPAGDAWLRDEIARARDLSEGGPFGVGFITHLIPVFPTMFDVALEERVPVFAFSFADPSPWIARAKAAGARVICQVQEIASAEQAVRAGTDVLVVQGNEAGGHTGSSNLFPLLLRAIAEFPEVPVLAAGGIASGRALAAVLSAGADGAWLGTAMLATPECHEVADAYKRQLVAARSEDTVFTEVFDILDVAAFGIPPWPDRIAGRAIRNDFLRTWHGNEASLRARLDQILPEYLLSLTQGDIDKTAIWAGESVDQIAAIRPVAEIVRTICEQAGEILNG